MPQSVALHHYARRLQRLLTIINEIKTTPHQVPEALYTRLGISRAMFYKDCQVLKALGLTFHYDRQHRVSLAHLDGSFIFTVEVSEPREVGWWALQWGPEAEVLEPESLRREMAETAKALGAVYEKREEHR